MQTHHRLKSILFSRPSILAVACALAQAALGYDAQIASIAPSSMTTPRYLVVAAENGIVGVLPESTNDQAKLQAVRSAYVLAVIVGAILTFFVGNILGRKTNVAIGACLNGIGCVIQTSAFGPPQWLAGRVLSGLGCGLNSASAPVWQVEVSETRRRGRLVLLQLAARAVGSVVARWTATAYDDVYGAPTRVTWRLPMGMQLFFVLGLFVLLPLLPESPRFV